MHNLDAECEACLNRQILNNYVKRKTKEDLCEKQRKLMHKNFEGSTWKLSLIKTQGKLEGHA